MPRAADLTNRACWSRRMAREAHESQGTGVGWRPKVSFGNIHKSLKMLGVLSQYLSPSPLNIQVHAPSRHQFPLLSNRTAARRVESTVEAAGQGGAQRPRPGGRGRSPSAHPSLPPFRASPQAPAGRTGETGGNSVSGLKLPYTWQAASGLQKDEGQ